MRARGSRLALIVVAAALVASGCSIHIIGDSTALAVKEYTNLFSPSVHMTGSATPSCGYGAVNGNRVTPSLVGIDPGYPSCVLDLDQEEPDDPGDLIVAFVSLHDAMCSTIDGCLPFDTAAYDAAHTALQAKGHPVAWVEVPPVGDQAMRDRAAGLNAAVAQALGCQLVGYQIREAATWDGIHYLPSGAWTVAGRLSELDASDACP